MTNMMPRYHFRMSRADFIAKKESGHFSSQYGTLGYHEIPATIETFLPLLRTVGEPWEWENKPTYQNQRSLAARLSEKETQLITLTDSEQSIGYSLIVKPSQTILQNMPSAFMGGSKIIEIENLGLFPCEAGKGRGGKFFEMLFDRLFVKYDYVYWSMSSSNHKGLFNYYKNKMGMTHIGTDYVRSFRSSEQLIPQDNQKIAA